MAWVTRKAQPAVRALPVPPSATWHPTRSLSPITLPDLYCMPQLHRARAFSAHASQTHSAPLKLRSCWPGGGAGQPGGGRRVQSQDRDRNGVLRSKPPPAPAPAPRLYDPRDCCARFSRFLKSDSHRRFGVLYQARPTTWPMLHLRRRLPPHRMRCCTDRRKIFWFRRASRRRRRCCTGDSQPATKLLRAWLRRR